MKKLLLLLAAASFITACNNESKTETTGASTETPAVEAVATKPDVPLAYVPNYSNSFEFGNQEYSAMILQGSWKDWDDNKLDNMKNWLADSVLAIHSDMLVVQGSDKLMAKWKSDRSKYKVVLDSIDVVMPIYLKDKKEHWVLVWATSITTDLKGKIDTSAIHEAWRINKDGKADFLNQYDRAKRKR